MNFILPLLIAGFVPRIHFSSDSFKIEAAQNISLEQNVSWLQNHPRSVLILEGHCDEWGEQSYNMELGDRRAREVKAYLIEKAIEPERIIMVVSFGEDQPIDPGHFREAWRKNRRVEFILR